ncbi:MAG: DUF72 domain-containing protein [Nitrospirae bacterium]|nr:MAG: DUF72 domain-containing protein [Nitrospirota bacterium]
MAELWLGTSGWTYASWRGRFYPETLPSRDYLTFYAREFPTTEINYSFYHLPKPQTFVKWSQQVPPAFLFAVKASRFITHIKQLREVEEPWQTFVHNAAALGSHLGPILLQFPPSLKCDIPRLQAFLEMAGKAHPQPLRLACEFRHESWFAENVYRILERHNVALCIADSPKYPRRDLLTADFAYIRFHGRTALFASRYTKEELRREAQAIRRYLKDGHDVFVYFNNDAMGYAVENARMLRALLSRHVSLH